VACKVANGVLLHLGAHHLTEESSGLGEVAVGVIGPVPGDETSHSVGAIPCLLVESERVSLVGAEGVRLIVGSRS
jgi:hypothetical protein